MTGSTDNTKDLIDTYINKNKLEIKYFYQENQGKMKAINNLIPNVSGDLIIECDSDDILYLYAFKYIGKYYSEFLKDEQAYAMVFLKYNQNNCNIGSIFSNDDFITTMFDMYFKQNIVGDKALVYKSSIRKNYNYILEKNEKFSTEARMHHKIDKSYHIIGYNKPIMICNYQPNGYSKNINKIFIENPYGYLEYFKEIFEMNLDKITFNKRLYIIKHYILFCYLTKQKQILKNVKGKFNKLITVLLIIPGYVKSFIFIKQKESL